MSKLAFTYGEFDCINQDHIRLLKEMRKAVLPDGKIFVVIADDYSCFCNRGLFPIQTLEQRINNLKYFARDFQVSYSGDPSNLYLALMAEAKSSGSRVIYVGYEDNKSFPGLYTLQKNKVPVKYIKKYAKKA